MNPIDNMVRRVASYAPQARLRQNYRLVDRYDGPGSNPEIVDWDEQAIGKPVPTRAELEAVVLPSAGTHFGAAIDAFLASRNRTDMIVQHGLRVIVAELRAMGSTMTMGQFVDRMKASAKAALDS